MSGRRPTRGPLRRWPALVVLLLLVHALGLATASVAVVPAAGGDAPPTLRLASVIEPAVLGPDTPLQVQVRVTAGSRTLPATTQVALGLQTRALTSRAAVDRWAATGTTGPPGTDLRTLPIGEDLPAGQSRHLQLTVPATDLPLTEQDAWGPRGLRLALKDRVGRQLDAVHTFVVWRQPVPEEQQPTLTTVIVPVTAGTADPRTGAMSQPVFQRQVQPGGRLDATLAAAAVPGAVVALDPMLLDPGGAITLTASGPEAAPEATSAPEVTAWHNQLLAVVQDHETLVLGYADPDVNALVHADQTELLRRGQDLGIQLTEAGVPDRSSLRADIAFPPDAAADEDSVTALREIGRDRALIVSGSAAPLRGSQAMTQTARAEVRTPDGTMPLLVTDEALSRAMAQVAEREGTQTGPAAVQRLRADSAALARELPGRSRHILVTAPRDWSPTPENAYAAVSTLTTTPWNRPVSLQSLLDAEPGLNRSHPRISQSRLEAELPAFGLREVGRQLTEIDGLAAILTDPEGVSRTVSAQAVSLSSWQWRHHLDGWRDARRIFASTAQTLRSAVHVVPGSPVTQVSRNVRLPVTVQNDASQPVRVVLDVTPQSNRLVVPEQVTVDIPASSRAVAYVPVRGVGSGDTAVRVQPLLTNGARVGEPAVIKVQVRADWESRGVGVVGAVVGLVLLIGLVRSIRRGTRARRLARAEQVRPVTGSG